LTLEQYNILVGLLNIQSEIRRSAGDNKYTTQIMSIEGKDGIDYGED